jgi:hypothetical protein
VQALLKKEGMQAAVREAQADLEDVFVASTGSGESGEEHAG